MAFDSLTLVVQQRPIRCARPVCLMTLPPLALPSLGPGFV